MGAQPTPVPDPQINEGIQERFLQFDGPFQVPFVLNGKPVELRAEPRMTLLDLLRHHVDPPLTGTKEGCDRGSCGACTVLLDGRPVYACSILASNLYKREVTTIEGLGTPDELSTVQQAFCDHDAMMCGFCTPGFVLSVTACLEQDPDADEPKIRAATAGNLCRCGTQPQVVAAALAAGERMKEER